MDMDMDGLTRGKHPRVRDKIPTHEPLVHAFFLKTTPDEEGCLV